MAEITKEYLEQKFGGIDQRFSNIDQRFGNIDQKLEILNNEVKVVQKQVVKLQEDFEENAGSVANGFEDIQRRLTVTDRVQGLETDVVKIKEALHLTPHET